ncbi:MBL fold metallo-hydrolase [Halobacillus rhizosphaerae]|uniref:MBL fold metallo-hydrolase n=1 Tax=Halobacillus rhizosphaerae TaxID=3064889 RepID=UPI00398A7D7E
MKPEPLDNRIYLIDGFDLGLARRTGTYVLEEEHLTLIETGPSPSIPHVLEGLKQLNIRAEDIRYIIVTHIHLDHAGGAGLLLRECPNAEIIVHPKGKRHLHDPSRLIAGAKAVYSEQFEKLFDPIVPIPEHRIVIKQDGETLKIGNDRTLVFYDTPGHANHHLAIYDSLSNGLFTGDTAGIRYHQTLDHGFTFYLPTTSPNQFNPQAMKTSIQRFRETKADVIYFGHYGVSESPAAAFDEVESWLPVFIEAGEIAMKEGEGRRGIERRLYDLVSAHLLTKGIQADHKVFEILRLDLSVCAMGIADYLNRRD